jgi:hypothetical protein
MADPRNVRDYSEIDALQVTYGYDGSIVYDQTKVGGSAQVGRAVRFTADEVVGLTIDASPVEGKLISVAADGNCVVQVRGYCDMPAGTGATFTLGAAIVGALLGGASGYIRGRAAATLAEVAVQRGRVINDNTTTAVVVDLG